MATVSRIRKKYQIHTKYEAANKSIDEVLDTAKQKLGTLVKRLRGYVNASGPSKFRPITCLTSFYKIITACISNNQRREHYSLIAEQQKGCKKGAYGYKEQLVIDNIIMRQAQVKIRNLYGGFVDYKKAYDMMPHSWLLLVIRLNKICEVIQGFLAYMMQNWKTTICP
jgi:Reverse transcriptase (RNA-dependent DNA polymerase)